jgi:hypothetical protein
LREQREMLMAVQLPDDFVIACAGCIQVGDAAKVGKPGFNAAEIIAPPVNHAAGVDIATKYRYAARENRSSTAIDFMMKVRVPES